MQPKKIPFSHPFATGDELAELTQVLSGMHWQGNGNVRAECEGVLSELTKSRAHLLTHSCTGALEMIALLLDLNPGDEVIMPSYTFVSTANAFIRSGAVPVFVDIDQNSKNIDHNQIESAITNKTKAIVAVNYAGVCSPLDKIEEIASNENLAFIEDAAQSIGAKYKNKPLGSYAAMSAFSFHATKNIAIGEGGSLAINDAKYLDRAKIIHEKGTNRSAFLAGETDKYTWVDQGSSFLPSEFTAAILKAQLRHLKKINGMRMEAWDAYHSAFADLENRGFLERMYVPKDCKHNAHIYYLMLRNLETRDAFLAWTKSRNVQATFHYVPLHSSPAGIRFSRTSGTLANTDDTFHRLVRLPLFPGVPYGRVIDIVLDFFRKP
ncbi:MAG: dTDP-4-amino-4,6-dideoxygalactose transaminase [Pirellulaceae bacterium]|nr:dTDP-4-amino-4,6-dideoxygalactose transaminase [Pirellulaceae bacterium]